MADEALQDKYRRMQQILRSLERVVVAFSAGVDSTFLLKAAVDTLGRENVLAVTGNSDSVAQAELQEARKLAELVGAEHVIVQTDEFDDPNYTANPANRCYYCKSSLYRHLQRLMTQRGFKAIVAGVNADDLGDWRPGIRAGEQYNVRAPVAEAGLTKQEIRILSRQMGLPTYDKPASPCLASRIPYGEQVTPEKLRMIEQAEAFLRQLGLRECRVRHHHGNLARIEIPAEQISEFMQPQLRMRIDEALRRIGYSFVAMDLRGFRSGALNEAIRISGQSGEQGDVRPA